MKNNQIILGLLGGFAAGAILGILFAPHKGKKTREMISKKGKGYANELKGKFNSFNESATNQYNGLVKDTKNQVSKNVDL